MEAHYIGFNMWVKAVEKTKSTDPDKVIDTLPGIEVPNLTGGTAKMLPNHHITKPVYIGAIRADGQFDVVWKTRDLVRGNPFAPPLLARALQDGRLVSSAKQKTVYIKTQGGTLLDAGTGEPISGPPPDDIDTVRIDNRVRKLIYEALGALR